MFKINDLEIKNALLLAPMEDVTDISFRKVCKDLGADVVYTEFVNSEGIIRSVQKTLKKLEITEEERPVGIQIYGENIESMVEAAKRAEAENPDIIDINAGCWVKKIANRGAGAGLLKDPPYLEKMVSTIVKSVNKPVTVKTRIGWDSNEIKIIEIAKLLENCGIKALTIHARTRCQGHSGDPDWSWINRVKETVQIPVVLNGGIFSAEDAKRAFNETGADGIMIARGAIGQPWIFREIKELLEYGFIKTELNSEERIRIALEHLKLSILVKGERRAILEFRKYYSGYLKGLHGASAVRQKLVVSNDLNEIEQLLLNFRDSLIHFETQDKIS